VSELLKRLRRSTLSGDLTVLYGAQVAGLIVPIVTIPYLARVLRPEGFGLLVFAQSFAAWLSLVLEYGFDLSATRAVARVRGDRVALTDVVTGVQGAKIVLTAGITVAAAIAYPLVPFFRGHGVLLFWAWAFAVLKGLSPFWFFLGTQRMRFPATLDAGSRVIAALGVFVWVRAPDDGWRVIALQTVASGASLAMMTGWLYQQVPVRSPTRFLTKKTFRESAAIFVFRASSGIYIQANAFILGLMTMPQVVAYFGGAEKIVRAAINLLNPISQALFPRLSHLVIADPIGAKRLFRYTLLGMLGLGLSMGLVAFFGAVQLVRILLGPGYEAAVPVLKILAILPVLVALGGALGLHWALPLGHDKAFYRLVLAGGGLNLALALILAPRSGAVGMAIAVISAELLVSSGLLILFRLHRFSKITKS